MPTRDEHAPGSSGARDSDGDGVPDYLDDDDDDDGIPTADEVELAKRWGEDLDGDNQPNYLDTDSDGDGLSDRAEGLNAQGTPEYLSPGGIAGGARCSLGTPHGTRASPGCALAMLALLAARRRRRQVEGQARRRPSREPARPNS